MGRRLLAGTVMTQHRGFNFVAVHRTIVIVEPSTQEIVGVLPRDGQSTAVAPSTAQGDFLG